MLKALNHLYTTYPALSKYDDYTEGFEWINCIAADETIVSFIRKTDKEDETLLFVCNFTPVVREKYKVGVPFSGKFKEIFNSDAKEFGGEGHINPRLKQSKANECDGRDDSIQITVPPLGVSIFTCTQLPPAKSETKKATKRTVRKGQRRWRRKIPAAAPVIEVLKEETDDKSPIVSASGFTSKTDEPKVSPKKASGKKKSRARRKKGR